MGIFRRLAALVLLCGSSLLWGTAFSQQQTLLVNKTFGAVSIIPGASTTMTITLFNTDTVFAQNDINFTDTFPAGLSWTGLVSNTCGGSIAPMGGGTFLELISGTLPSAPASGPSSCQITVNVTSNVTGNKQNQIPAGAVTGTSNGQPTVNGTGAGATLGVDVLLPVSVTKAFSGTTGVSVPGTFSITVRNPNSFALTGVALTDDLASDVVVNPSGGAMLLQTVAPNTTPVVTNSCGGTVSATHGGTLVQLSGGSIAADSICTVTVSYIATAAGTYTNTIPVGRVTTDAGAASSNTQAAPASVAIQDTLRVTKDYGSMTAGLFSFVNQIQLGNTVLIRLEFHNPLPNPVTNLAVTDTFPDQNGNSIPDIVVANAPPIVSGNTCGGTVTAVPGSSSISVSGVTVPAATFSNGIGFCQMFIRVRGNDPVFGSINSIAPGDVTGTVVGIGAVTNTNLAEDSIDIVTVGGPIEVGIWKGYINSSGVLSQTGTSEDASTVVRSRIVITNPTDFGLTGNTLQDTFQALTAQGAPSDVVLSGGGNFTFLNCGESGNSNFSPAFGFPTTPTAPSVSIASGGQGFTINDISLLPTSGDDLGFPNGINGACVIEFDVVGSVTGTHRNILPIGAISDGVVADASFPGTTLNAAETMATFTYVSRLSVTKIFEPQVVVSNSGVSRLRITLQNTDTAEINSLAFTDTFPVISAGERVVVAPNPNVSNTCGGTVTATPNGGSVALSGGTLGGQVGAVPGLCEVMVDVIALDDNDGNSDFTGGFANIIGPGAVTGTLATTGSPSVSNTVAALGDLFARRLDIGVSKAFSPNEIDGGDFSDLTITVTNPNMLNWHLPGLALVDNLPAGMLVADPLVASTTCTTDGMPDGPQATVTAAPGSGTIGLSGAFLSAVDDPVPGTVSSCSVTVRVTTLVTGTLTNTVQAGDVTSSNGASNTEPFSASLVVLPKVAVEKEFFPNVIPMGGIAELEIRIFNANGSAANDISVLDVMPSEVLVAPGPVIVSPVAGTTCSNLVVNATPGGNAIQATGLDLAPFTECRFRVQVTSDIPSTAPHYINTILSEQVSSLEGGIRTEDATAVLQVVNRPVVTKSFSDTDIDLNETTTLTIRVANPVSVGASLSSVNLVDNLPVGLVVATIPAVSTNGACSAGTVSAVAGASVVSWTNGTLAAGEFCEISVSVMPTATGTLINTLPACDGLANPPVAGVSAGATAISGGITTCNELEAGATLNVSDASPDLVIAKTHQPDRFIEGQSGTIVIRVGNLREPPSLGEVTVIDTLPAGLTVAAIDGAGAAWNCTGVGTGTATCTTTTPIAGNTPLATSPYVITITANVATGAASLPANDPAAVNHVVISGGGEQPDFDVPGDRDTGTPGNTDEDPIDLIAADAVSPIVEKSFSDSDIDLSETTTLTIRVTNPATDGTTLTNVNLVDNLPAGLIIADVPGLSVSGACATGTISANAGASVVSWAGGVLNAGEFCEISVTVSATQTGSLINVLPACDAAANPPVAGTSAAATAELDGFTLCNPAEASATIDVQDRSPDLVVSKSHEPGEFVEGHPGTVTIRVGNLRASATSGEVVVTDTLPAGLTVAAIDGAGASWNCSGVGTGAATCTTTTPIAGNTPLATSPYVITLTVDVAPGAASLQGNQPFAVNQVTVSGGGELPGYEQPGDRDTGTPGNTDEDPIALIEPGAVSGTVWYDIGTVSRTLDSGDLRLADWIVEVYEPGRDGAIPDAPAARATTQADGTYSIDNLKPGIAYKLVFRDPETGVVLGIPEPGCVSGVEQPGLRLYPGERGALEVTVQAGEQLPCANLPVDPSGVVYDAAGRNPVQNARVIMTPVGVCAGYDPNLHIVNADLGGYTVSGSSISMLTNFLGLYQFFFTPDAPASCQFELSIESASIPDHKFVSSLIAPSGPLTAPAGIGTIQVQPQGTPPTGNDNTVYHLLVTVGSATFGIVHNHIPVDPGNGFGLIITKVGSSSVVELGDSLKYTIRIKNVNGPAILPDVKVDDVLPAGFRYIAGTARLNGSQIADPTGSPGPALQFTIGDLPVGMEYELTYRVRVGVGAQQGDGINRAQAASGFVRSNVARFKVKVTGGVFTDEACVAGKIFVDVDGNRLQDIEEIGIPGVRLFMEDGTYFITDVEGKYSYCGLSPKSHVIKVDPNTLPRGAKLVPSSNRNLGDGNSLFLDVKRGELIRGDFIVGNPTDAVLNQVKARRAQGEVSAPQTEKKGAPALVFESRKVPPLTNASPEEGINNTSDQAVPRVRQPQAGPLQCVTESACDQPPPRTDPQRAQPRLEGSSSNGRNSGRQQ